MAIENKKVNVDIDGDGKIELNKQEIEVAKKLPPAQSNEILKQKILFLEQHIETEAKRLDKLEDKIYKR